jgi:hypothetical protein
MSPIISRRCTSYQSIAYTYGLKKVDKKYVTYYIAYMGNMLHILMRVVL